MMTDFDFSVIWILLPFLWEGLQLSLWLTFLAVIGGIVLGTLLALARLSGIVPLAFVAAAYVNLIRSVPLILVIFWFFFLVPLCFGRPVGSFYSALIAFVLFEAAYYSEIMRAGIQSVARVRSSAGQSTGSELLANTALCHPATGVPEHDPDPCDARDHPFPRYVIGVRRQLRDFMTASSIVARTEGRLVEMYVFAALVYFVICFTGSMLVEAHEDRMAT